MPEPVPDRIEIRGLRVLGSHGIHDFEKQFAQPFEIDLLLEVDLAAAAASDHIDDTVSYVDVINAAKAVVQDENYNLIETLAERIASVALHDERVGAVEVTVRKPHAAVGIDMAFTAVTIRRSRP